MVIINVVLKGGGITVSPETAYAHKGEEVIWCFDSQDPDLTSVGIEFKDEGVQYFTANQGSSGYAYKRDLLHKNNAQCHIWGVPPSRGVGRYQDSYSVYGLVGTKMVYFEDPDIIVDEP